MWRTVEGTFVLSLEIKSQDADLLQVLWEIPCLLLEILKSIRDIVLHLTVGMRNISHKGMNIWDFESGPFLGSYIGTIFLYVTLLFLPCFFYMPLVSSGCSFSIRGGVCTSLTHKYSELDNNQIFPQVTLKCLLF